MNFSLLFNPGKLNENTWCDPWSSKRENCTFTHREINTNTNLHLCAFVLPLFQKKEWLCLNCQTLRLMSGEGLDEPPLPVPHPSPKHQAAGSPRHQTPTSQQSPLHKPTTQQGSKPGQPQTQTQKPQAGSVGSGLFAPTAAKQPTETKTTGPVPTAETEKQLKPAEEKLKTEPETQPAKETKPSQKKGEQITPIKDIKKSRHYDVSLLSVR